MKKVLNRIPTELLIFTVGMGFLSFGAILAFFLIQILPHEGLEPTRAKLLWGVCRTIITLATLSIVACALTAILPEKKRGAP